MKASTDASGRAGTEAARRPLASRSTGWARLLAARLAASSVTPNQISLASVVFAGGGAALTLWGGWVGLTLAAAMVQLRLLCNLLDGMVAIEGGKASALGTLYNEIPDRIADSLLIVAAGYAAGVPWLGWAGALAAALTAYLRMLGGSLGFAQDFGGIMSKPRRMAALTAGLLAAAAETALTGTQHGLAVAVGVIGLGSLVTCATRTRTLAAALSCRG
ncbi:MAG: CDP-alcohol phosphatidyltransferase family protein [Alphaproteobacteria bacterium]